MLENKIKAIRKGEYNSELKMRLERLVTIYDCYKSFGGKKDVIEFLYTINKARGFQKPELPRVIEIAEMIGKPELDFSIYAPNQLFSPAVYQAVFMIRKEFQDVLGKLTTRLTYLGTKPTVDEFLKKHKS